MKQLQVGVSRLNYPLIDGVVNGCPSHLLEPSRLQKIQYSEAFDNAYWNKLNNVTVSAEKVISPDGTLNASQLIFDGTSGGRIEKPITGLTQGADYTVSVYARVSSGTQVVNFGSVNDFEYTLTTEWQRLTSTQAENDTTAYPRFICDDATTIEIWGAQLEQGSYPTSYIPNYGTAAGITRSAETANGAGSASTFNDSEGVLMAEISFNLNDDFPNLSIFNNTNLTKTDNKIVIYKGAPNSNQISVALRSGGSEYANITANVNVEDYNKIVISYKSNEVKYYLNGFLIGTDNTVTVPIGLDTLNFDSGIGSNNVYGNIKQIQYFDSALNDSDLETITSWTSFTDLANGQLYSIK